MNKEEIIDFLKENLSIRTKSELSRDYYTDAREITIELVIGDEVISEDYISIESNNNND